MQIVFHLLEIVVIHIDMGKNIWTYCYLLCERCLLIYWRENYLEIVL